MSSPSPVQRNAMPFNTVINRAVSQWVVTVCLISPQFVQSNHMNVYLIFVAMQTLWLKRWHLHRWINCSHFWSLYRHRQCCSWISIVIWPRTRCADIWAAIGTSIRTVSSHKMQEFLIQVFDDLHVNVWLCAALAITHAFPCRNSRHDRDKASEVEASIQRHMLKNNLILVGWYHSHPKMPAQPTLRDCDAQLEYQIKMRGMSEATYTPCIGLICGEYEYSNNGRQQSQIHKSIELN